jgi:hypothetical protein
MGRAGEVRQMTNEERLDYFLAEVARGTVKEFLEAPEASLRLGVLAAIVVNQLVEFIYEAQAGSLHPKESMDNFRRRLAKDHCPDLPLLRKVAEATKHPRLDRERHGSEIFGIEAVRSQHPQICGRDGNPITSRGGEPLEGRLAVSVTTQSGARPLTAIVTDCFAALERLIASPKPVL